MSEKRDWLTVCNEHGLSVEDFALAFCHRCLTPDCSRSNAGKSQFEQRVSTWRERLFERPTRMPDNDPRLVQISTKRFIDIETGPAPEIGRSSAWADPRDLPGPSTLASTESKQPSPAPLAAVEPPAVEPQAVEPQGGSDAPLRLMNTPKPAAQMLGGVAPPQAATPAKDPWEAKPAVVPSAEPGAVKLGARIRFPGV